MSRFPYNGWWEAKRRRTAWKSIICFRRRFFLRATFGGYNKIGEDNDRVANISRALGANLLISAGSTLISISRIITASNWARAMAYTPSVRLAGDPSGGYRVLNGVDLTYRYQPLGSAVYQGLTWGSEFYTNNERFPTD